MTIKSKLVIEGVPGDWLPKLCEKSINLLCSINNTEECLLLFNGRYLRITKESCINEILKEYNN